MRTRRIIGVVFAVGILCFCFAGSIDNSATRPWVRSLIDYVTGTVVPTSSVAYATSAASAETLSKYDSGLEMTSLIESQFDQDSQFPLWRGGLAEDMSQYVFWGWHTNWAYPYNAGFGYYHISSLRRWILRLDANNGVALDITQTTNFQYRFGTDGNVVTNGAAGVSFSGTTTLTNLVVNGTQTNNGTLTVLGGGNVITSNYPNAVFSQTTSVTRLSVGSGFKFDMWINGGGPWAYFDAMGLATLDFIPSTVQTTQPLLTFHFADWYSYFRSDVYVTSNLNVTGTATVSRVVQTTGDWDDLNFPAVESARVGVDDIEFNSESNGLVFKTTCSTNLTDDHELRMVHFPHSWATNTPIRPHIHFVQTSADHTNMFFLRYKWYNNGSLVPSTWTDLGYASNTLAYTSGEMVQIAVWPQIQAVRNISSIMDVKIYRDGSVGTGDVLEKQFDIHIRRDTFGSVAEFTK